MVLWGPWNNLSLTRDGSRFRLLLSITGWQEAEWLCNALRWTLYDLYHILDGVKPVAPTTQTGLLAPARVATAGETRDEQSFHSTQWPAHC